MMENLDSERKKIEKENAGNNKKKKKKRGENKLNELIR